MAKVYNLAVPISPKENRLKVRIEAGENNFDITQMTLVTLRGSD